MYSWETIRQNENEYGSLATADHYHRRKGGGRGARKRFIFRIIIIQPLDLFAHGVCSTGLSTKGTYRTPINLVTS